LKKSSVRCQARSDAALLWTLEHGLGAAFTPTVRDAWTSAYHLLAGAMQEAAREVETVA
jgi:hemoglobin-like flavoprotein